MLVASLENNSLEHPKKLEILQMKLAERRNGLNLVSFVVDPDGASANESTSASGSGGIVNMSVCSSYMPSTYRRAGFGSQASTTYAQSQSFVNKSFNRPAGPSVSSHNLSVNNKGNKQAQEPRPPQAKNLEEAPNVSNSPGSTSSSSPDPTLPWSETSAKLRPPAKVQKRRSPPASLLPTATAFHEPRLHRAMATPVPPPTQAATPPTSAPPGPRVQRAMPVPAAPPQVPAPSTMPVQAHAQAQAAKTWRRLSASDDKISYMPTREPRNARDPMEARWALETIKEASMSSMNSNRSGRLQIITTKDKPLLAQEKSGQTLKTVRDCVALDCCIAST